MGRGLSRPIRAIAIWRAWTLQALVGDLISWTASGAPANLGVLAVGPWNAARRHTPLSFLAPGSPGDLEPREADDVVVGVVGRAAGGVPHGHGDDDLVVDVVGAVGAHPVAGEAADPVDRVRVG
jgi:hypothetical protein